MPGKILLLLLLYFSAFSSCKKTSLEIPEIEKIDSVSEAFFIQAKYGVSLTNTSFIAKSKIEYQGNRVFKRSGSYLPIAWGGYFGDYTDKIYDTVSYDGNKIFIRSVNLLNSRVVPGVDAYFLYVISGGKVKQRIRIHNINGIIKRLDTIDYIYNHRNQLYKVLSYNSGPNFRNYREYYFFYNINNNLTRIEGKRISYRNNAIAFQSRTVEEFEGYDNAANPLKSLWMWDDLFYRSLSSNNFSTYTYCLYDSNNIPQEYHKTVLTLHYDANGKILL
ncbi:MAG: hypothetical protein K2Q24_05940 [Chitinophagaceae bacterium]|jgi:hypothetical protein|nr:hypothetical protein [Chitinophagaceae bacterium]